MKEENIDYYRLDKCEQIAKTFAGSYDYQTNTFDCKGHDVQFRNSWLDENGSFDFKLINTSISWDFMFDGCSQLKYLPEDFIIPDHVKSCNYMFNYCTNLEKLPQNFILPNSVTMCVNMFYGCISLTELPQDFTIPNSVTLCRRMFANCLYLDHLPTNFHIPDKADYQDIFLDCNHGKFNAKDYLIVEL